MSGSAAAVIDGEGRPLVGDEAMKRFQSFENGPCPVLEGLAHELKGPTPADSLDVEQHRTDSLDSGASEATLPLMAAIRAWLRNPGWHRRAVHWQA